MRHINGITKVITCSLTISEFHQKLSCQIFFDLTYLNKTVCIETKASRSETIAEWPCSCRHRPLTMATLLLGGVRTFPKPMGLAAAIIS